jgi:membrane protease YdiL (CAAX protease family)
MGSVFVCVCAGSVLQTVAHFAAAGGKISPKIFYPLAAAAVGGLMTSVVVIAKRWKFEHLLRRLLVLVVCLYPGLFLAVWLQKVAGPSVTPNSVGSTLLATLSFQGAALVLIAIFLRQQQVSWNEAFGFTNRWGYALLFGLIAGAFFLQVGWRLQEVCFQLITRFSQSPTLSEEQQPVQVLRIASSVTDRIALGSVTILLAPVAEELLFRGILYPWIKKAGFPNIAFWGTAVLFAAIHTNLVAFLPLFVLAVILTLLYEFTNNLLAPITAHAVFNATNFVMLYLTEKHPV